MCCENKRRLGCGRKPLLGKRAEHVQGSVFSEGGQRSTILEILRGMKRKEEIEGERGVLAHSGAHPESTNGKSLLKK